MTAISNVGHTEGDTARSLQAWTSPEAITIDTVTAVVVSDACGSSSGGRADSRFIRHDVSARIYQQPGKLHVTLVELAVLTTRNDFAVERLNALGRRAEHIEAVALLRSVTRPDDVVVGSYGAVRLIIGPSGRKTVAPDEYFANPYVEYSSRRLG